MRKRKKIIQVPIGEDLLARLDKVAYEIQEPRAAVIREACARYITNREAAELERQYIEGYRRYPESDIGDAARLALISEAWAHLGPWDDDEEG